MKNFIKKFSFVAISWLVFGGAACAAASDDRRDMAVAPELQRKLQGAKRIMLDAKFNSDDNAAAPAASVAPNDGYASLRYTIGTSAERDYIAQVLAYMAQTLPATFGNTTGTYTITVTVKDLAGVLLVKEPVVSFQWSKERGLLFFDKTVSDVQKASWSGTLIGYLPIAPSMDRVRVGIEVNLQRNKSLDFDLLKKSAKTISTSALAALMPLPAAALPMLDSLTELANAIYAGSENKSLVNEEELSLLTNKPLKAPVNFSDQSGNKFVVPIMISVEGFQSRFVQGRLANGKFAAGAISDAIFTTSSIPIGDGRAVGVLELITTSSDARYARTRTMLDTLMAGASYGRDPQLAKEADLGARCNDLYDALHRYLSKYDARAMYWAFLQRFGDSIRKDACLNTGRQAELQAIGLP